MVLYDDCASTFAAQDFTAIQTPTVLLAQLASVQYWVIKSQGQSLQNVGLYLSKPVFTHGQLYVALSRVTNIAGLKILIHDNSNDGICITTNVVYREIFRNAVLK